MNLLQIDSEIANLESHIARLRTIRAELGGKMVIHTRLREAATLDEALHMQASANPGKGIHWKDLAKIVTWYEPSSVYQRLCESVRIYRLDPTCECSMDAAPWRKSEGTNDGIFYSRF